MMRSGMLFTDRLTSRLETVTVNGSNACGVYDQRVRAYVR